MAQKVKELEFDYGIGTKLPFKVCVLHWGSVDTPVYEAVNGRIRGGVICSRGTYHWLKETYDTVEDFSAAMAPYKIQETT